VNNPILLPSDALTLTEILRSQGYRTGAFVSVGVLSNDSNAEQGFEVLGSPSGKQRPADRAVDRALEWIHALDSNDPFLAWVHLFAPHQPYSLPDSELGRVAPTMFEALLQIGWPRLVSRCPKERWRNPGTGLDHALSPYRAEVA